MTTTISPLTSSRKWRASSPSVPRATSSWSLVSSRQTAASAVGGKRGERRQRGRQPPRRLERDHGLGRARARARARRARRGRKPSKRQRSAGSPEATSAVVTADGPGQHLDLEPALEAGADQDGSRDRRSPACRHRRSAPPWRRARSAATSWRARSASFCSWLETKRGAVHLEPLVEAPGAAGVLAGDEVGLLERAQRTRAEILEVADRRRADGQAAGHQAPPPSRRALLERHLGGADHPRVGAELGGDHTASRSSAAAPASRTSRARRLEQQLARGGRRRRRSRSRRARRRSRGSRARPRGGGRSSARTSAAIPSPGERGVGDRLAVDLLACGERPAERRVRVGLGRQPALAPERGARRRAPRRSRGSGSCPGNGGPSWSMTTWPSSAPAPGRCRDRARR